MLPLVLCSTAAIYWSLHLLLQYSLQSSREAARLRLSAADVADISTKLLSAVHASLASGAGLYIMWETMDDCLYSRSAAIAPFTYIGVSYMSCDLLAMYLTYCRTRNLTSRHNWLLFMRSRPLLVLHHLVLILGYPLLVYDSLRKGMGDFLIGTFFLRELSSPLLSAAKIMKRVKMTGSVLYRVNGAALVAVFFLVRVTNTPLTLLLYSAQHHHWKVLQALLAMRPVCHLLLLAELLLQLYWFSLVLSTALTSHKTKQKLHQ